MGKPTIGPGRRALTALVMLLLLAGLLPQPQVARAATIPVLCTGGVGDTADLIKAITTASRNRQSDVITLGGSPEEPCTYTLTEPHNTSGGANGLPVIGTDSGQSLTIVGNGATIRRSPGGRPFRLLSVDGGNLTLRDLTLDGGIAVGGSGAGRDAGRTGGFGGAIYNAGTLVLSAVTISGSEARGGDGASRAARDSGGGGGGGAGLGGAIFNAAGASLTIVSSTLSGNRARGGAGGSGGASGATYDGGGGAGSDGGGGGAGPARSSRPGNPGASAKGLGGGGGGGGGSDGRAGDPFAPGNPRAGAGGAGGFGGGGGGAGASRFGGSGGAGGSGGSGGGAGGDSCCSHAGGGGGGAGLGGAIFNSGGSVTITSSTIYGNSGLGGVGGPGSFGFGDGKPGAGRGAAIFTRGGAVSYRGSILAGNGASDCAADTGALTSLGFNLLVSEAGCGTAAGDTLAGPGDDLGLLPLARNGGATPTHALAPDSPAVDAGGPSCPAFDQRGVARPQGPACDSGAYELQSATLNLVVTSPADSGPGTLREAILAANAGPSRDTITFALPGGQLTIALATPLPALTAPAVIDALSQPGAAGAPTVTLDGSALAGEPDGLALAGGDSVVRGLIITGFGGAAISVTAGEGSTLRGNRFIGNGLAIDLGGDGPTPNDAGDGDPGPNTLLNSPALTATEGEGGAVVAGLLDAADGQYTVDLYAAPTCAVADNGEGAEPRLSGPGQGEPIASLAVSAGAPFSLAVAGRADQWFSATATDAAGNTSELGPCAPVRTNDLWTNAMPLDAGGGASVAQRISRPYQERWYRFTVAPGGRVRVRLDGQPGSILTLHRDLEQVYHQLTLPQSAEALAVDEQTTGFLPGAYLPGAYLPGAYLPGAYLPGAYLPGAYLPGAYLPGAYLPGAYLPGAYLPGAYLPGAYLPGAYLPGAYLPGAYLAAARAGLMAFAADPAANVLTIERNTWDLAEELYVRVVGPADTSFTLSVSFEGAICLAVTAPTAPEPVVGAVPAPGFRSLFVWDSARFATGDPAGAVLGATGLEGRLASFAAAVNGLPADVGAGAVIDLADAARYPRVAEARATLAANPSCVAAANILAREVKAVIDVYRAANAAGGQTTLADLTIVGADEVVPFFRYPDLAGLASESDYFPPVEDASPSNAALREGRVLAQDAYGSTVFIRRGAYELPVPDLAVGRLVGDAATVTGLLDAYSDAAVAGVVRPASALVTGYDFVADGAEAVFADLRDGLTAPGGPVVTPERLIQPEGLGPDDPGAWTAADLRAKLLDPAVRNDLVFFTGHFAAGSALAADYETSLLASEVADLGGDLTNTILFGLGCHSGYNVPGPDAIPGFSPEPDWAEAWARAGATYIAATGFAYGDTELVEYGERLLLNLARTLRTGEDPVAIGQALVRAKQDYLAQRASLSGIDEKTLLQFTLYGLPMLRVDMPGKLPAPSDPRLVDGLAPVGGNPYGLQLGTSGGSDVVTVASDPLTRTLTLTDTGGAPVEARYYEGQGGVVANPTEPILPLERREVDLADAAAGPQILRGVGFRGGRFEDRPGLALTSAPATENARGFLKFLSDGFYPSQPWSANHLDALRGGPTRLFAIPAQYRAGLDGGVFRVFSTMDFRLYYLDGDWPAGGLRPAGLAPAPEVVQVETLRLPGGALDFRVNVVDAAGVGVHEVWVTYHVPGSGRWQSVDLRRDPSAADPTLWVGPAGGVSLPDGTEFMLQAAGAAGKVSLDTNAGLYYRVPFPDTAEKTATSVELVSPPAGGLYGARVDFAALLKDEEERPVAGQTVRLLLGGQVALATTDGAGLAGLSLFLAQPPGSYDLQVTYGGGPGYGSAQLRSAFTIDPAPTGLRLDPSGPLAVVEGQETGLVATLTTAGEGGGPIADATVLFVAEGPAGRFGAAAKTSLDGRAVLGAVPWPVGAYAVTAYYAGNGPPPTGGPASPTVPYLPSQSQGVGLTISPAPPPDTAITAGPEGFVPLGEDVTIAFAGSGGRPRLSLECRLNGAPFAACTSPLTLRGPAEGAYSFEVRAVDRRGVADPTPATLSWRVVDWATIYRARQVGQQVWIERNVAAAGLGDADTGPSDGWAIVGRTNGERDDGQLRGFFVVSAPPYGGPRAVIFNRSSTRGDRCILVTPELIGPVLGGQDRPLRIVEVLAECPAP